MQWNILQRQNKHLQILLAGRYSRRWMSPRNSRRDEHLVDAWRDLLDSHARTHGALERALKEHDLGVSEFEVLERLMSHSAQKRRMQELGKAVYLSQSALSRVVGRLEQDGLVTRVLCPEDRRGVFVAITDAGRDRYEAARPAHRAALADALR
jgi:DNA-binding MarR family transcriptional regulator